MGVIIVSSLLIFANIIVWIVLAVRAKSIFTPEHSAEEFKDAINAIVKDLNSTTERDINLFDDRIRQFKQVSAEADRRVKILRQELETAENSKILTEQIEASRNLVKENAFADTSKEKPKKTKSSPKSSRVKASASPVDKYMSEQMQGNLFISPEVVDDDNLPLQVPVSEGVSSAEQRALFGSSSERSIPVVRPPEYLADIPAKKEKPKDFNTQVREKHEEGKNISEIASELGSSVQEVRLSLILGSR